MPYVRHRRQSLCGVTLTRADRLKNSLNGNPRWRLTFKSSDGTEHVLRTLSDSACGYQFSDRLVGSIVDAKTDGRGALISVEESR